MAREYFPWGSGFGSFPDVFKVWEPEEALGFTYTNHAHNDWLELLMTGGVPAMLLLLVVVAAWGWRTYVAWRVMKPATREARYARMASILVLMLALASVVDYPLRVPSMMGFAVVLALWLHRDSALPRDDAAKN